MLSLRWGNREVFFFPPPPRAVVVVVVVDLRRPSSVLVVRFGWVHAQQEGGGATEYFVIFHPQGGMAKVNAQGKGGIDGGDRGGVEVVDGRCGRRGRRGQTPSSSRTRMGETRRRFHPTSAAHGSAYGAGERKRCHHCHLIQVRYLEVGFGNFYGRTG